MFWCSFAVAKNIQRLLDDSEKMSITFPLFETQAKLLPGDDGMAHQEKLLPGYGQLIREVDEPGDVAPVASLSQEGQPSLETVPEQSFLDSEMTSEPTASATVTPVSPTAQQPLMEQPLTPLPQLVAAATEPIAVTTASAPGDSETAATATLVSKPPAGAVQVQEV